MHQPNYDSFKLYITYLRITFVSFIAINYKLRYYNIERDIRLLLALNIAEILE